MSEQGNGKPKLVAGLGELLWDMLPDGPQLGGAVSNFAVMSARLGDHAVIASRVGDDQMGRHAQTILSAFPVDSGYLQIDANHVTSSVTVSLIEGQAKYVINEPVAWDYLEFSPSWLTLAQQADAVCFGTLAQRSANAQRTIQGFLAETRQDCLRLLDVNLRAPFYSAKTLESSLDFATVLKMNDSEVPVVLELLGMPHSDDLSPNVLVSGARALTDEFPLALICITMGGNGSLLVSRSQVDRHPGVRTEVIDTVGAGDAFTAALAHYHLQGASLATMNEAGNRWGAWMASQRGAMPPLDEAKREEITAAIAQLAVPAKTT